MNTDGLQKSLRESYDLRQLLQEAQAILGASSRKAEAAEERDAQLRALEAAHERLMVGVHRKLERAGLGRDVTLSVEENKTRSLERNRLENFARKLHSQVHKYVKRGGDLRRLDPNEVNRQVILDGPRPKTRLQKLESQMETLKKLIIKVRAESKRK